MPDLAEELDDVLDPVLRAFTDTLQAKLTGRAALAYLRGSAQVISWGRTKLTDRPIFFEGPPIRQAIAYANKRGAQLVTDMDIETKSRLAKVIGDAIENKRGIPGLARDIRKAFDDMTKYRSKMIAQHETSDALGQSFLDRGKDMDITGKEWVLGSGGKEGNCQYCIDNADAGIIAFDQVFPGGVMVHPQHVGCTCATAPAMLPRQE